MKRYISVAVLSLLMAGSLLAQAPGWKVRVDRSSNASDPDAAGVVKFAAMGTGFHATNPKAAVYWNPANTAAGNYTLKGTFKLIKAGSSDEFYGLVCGGSNLEGSGQEYLYFMVAANGTWLIKRRNGDMSTQTVAGSASNAAIKQPGADGTSTNALEVRVMGDKIEFAVNGTVVNTTPKTGLAAKTDGIYGIRVNHMLEVMVDGFGVTKH